MAKKKDMGLNNYPFHNSNPFISGIVEDITTKRTRKVAGFKFQDVLNEETGALDKQTMLVLGTQKEVDKAEFTKLYRNCFVAFYGLSKSSLEIMDFISENIKYHNDRICLLVSDVMENKEIGYATVYRSIAQLIEKQLLAKAEYPGYYYVNPQIFFKGDRVILFHEYIKKDAKKTPIVKSKLLE